MLAFAAHDFQTLMTILPDLRHDYAFEIGVRGAPINTKLARKTEQSLGRCLELCQSLKLRVSGMAIRRFLDSGFRNLERPDSDRAIEEIENRIHDELAGELFFHVPVIDAAYLQAPKWIGIETLLQFPSVEWEATEAASCYALERYTACIFHLMRVLEYGLASLASALSVTITNPNWHQILKACEDQIKTLSAHDPNWRQNEQFYNGVALEFRHFSGPYATIRPTPARSTPNLKPVL
jgi:hypothetical protein